MKNVWKLMCIMVGLALVAAACGTAAVQPPAAQQPAAAEVQPATAAPAATESDLAVPIEAGADLSHLPVVTAVKVASIPAITADWQAPDLKSDPWKDAPATQIGGMQWRAIYTDTDISILFQWVDHQLQMNGAGTYLYDPAAGKWSQSDGFRSEWNNLAWNMDSAPVGEEGCGSLCHEDPPGSGIFHHNTQAGARIDSWMYAGTHGFTQKPGEGGVADKKDFGLPIGREDMGWIMGAISATQYSPIINDSNNKEDPRTIISGHVSFVDYAEDNTIQSHEDTYDKDRSLPRDKFCRSCHATIGLPYDPLEINLTYPDAGEIKYSGNWDAPYTDPKYIETAPKDFVDAMILAQAEVNSGEAVAVADLTPEQLNEYWGKYTALNAAVPFYVLQTPTDSMADVMVGYDWNNSVATIQILRKLTTTTPVSDVQFDDLTKDYHFALTITNSNQDLMLGDLLGTEGAVLRFQP